MHVYKLSLLSIIDVLASLQLFICKQLVSYANFLPHLMRVRSTVRDHKY